MLLLDYALQVFAATTLFCTPALATTSSSASSGTLTSTLGPVVNLGYAAYAGNNSLPDVTFYGGIPYIKPPVGNLRFAPPQQLDESPIHLTNDDVVDARNWGPLCIQQPAVMGIGVEDCVTLNIWTPSNATSKSKLPIDLFVSTEEATTIILRKAFRQTTGLPDLAVDSSRLRYSIALDSSDFFLVPPSERTRLPAPTTGFFDQRAGLEWIQRHITAFGGDPTKVTIGGESTGAGSVVLHLTAYGGEKNPPFRAAVIESSGNDPFYTTDHTEQCFGNVTKQVGCDGASDVVACLRKASLGAIVSAVNNKPSTCKYEPVIDGDYIPDITTKLLSAGKFTKVPILAGHNAQDGSIFVGTPASIVTDADIVTAILKRYPALTSNVTDAILVTYPPASNTTPWTTQWERAMYAYMESELACWDYYIGNVSGKPAFNYRWDAPDPNLLAARGDYVGAAHTAELFYLYDGTNSGPSASVAQPVFTVYDDAQAALAEQAVAWWSSFARSLDPNTFALAGSPKWDVASKGGFMVADTSNDTTSSVPSSGMAPREDDYPRRNCGHRQVLQALGSTRMTNSPLPSPMALSNMSPTSSIFKKRNPSTTPPKTAASYLSALSEADARRLKRSVTPTATPALSFSSSVTTDSEDAILHENEPLTAGLEYPLRAPTSEQVFNTVHSEFGHCANEEFRSVSEHVPGTPLQHVPQEPPYYIVISTYISYLILICMGHIRDFLGKRFYPKGYQHLMPRDGYAPLNSDFDSFYTRRLKTRMDECFNQPITGIYTGTQTRVLNISSYNYLGFAQAKGGCADAVEESIKRYGVSSAGARLEGGSTDLHALAESLVARFVGQEDALISSMGFATNSAYIPALVGKGCLVISDELNHASIRFGVRLSGANVRMFKHNDMGALENLLREAISQGQPKTHRPWKKILVLVEGLYSMEGTIVDLPKVIELKKKYKFYLFVDEAHSIGAIGPNGRGVCDFFGISPRNVDVLMGTFTKSFGAAGGYVSGNKVLIDRLRVRGYLGAYGEAMAPPVLMQIVSSMASIMGIVAPVPASSSSSSLTPSSSTSTLRLGNTDADVHPGPAPLSLVPSWLSLDPSLASGIEGRTRLRRLTFNSRYLHKGLTKLGFITYGHPMSPVIPLLLYNPGKMNMFHRLMKEYKTGIVVVVVSYPACALMTTRVRLCVSAAHTKDDIDTILRACDEIGDILDLKHGLPRRERWDIEEVCARAVELANTDDVHA
ncbi:PLP-dependent transferase [Mycena sanguinolenta]|uniref:serine C-palmitoyltransferase n=1 Tax=Mycena sanguinolenta TaxID=230812 RepID=A0A8H6YSR5_9AGAR|nr:PLP-dependent transferase [Mycena sanguinolenta]